MYNFWGYQTLWIQKNNDILKHNGVIFKNAPRPSVETISGLTQIKYTYIQALLENKVND